MSEIIDKLREEMTIRDLRVLMAEKSGSRINLERLKRYMLARCPGPFVVILDEIDTPAAGEVNTLLYNLCDLEKISLVCICNSRASLLALEDRVKSRLNPQTIEFKPYTATDLRHILIPRADLALQPEARDEMILKKIAELAEGDARVAIKTLKVAAQIAEYESTDRIEEQHIRKGLSSAWGLKRKYILKDLTIHHNLIYEIIKEHNDILPSDLREAYLVECGKLGQRPIQERTLSKYRRKLLDLRLITAEHAFVPGNVNKFRVA